MLKRAFHKLNAALAEISEILPADRSDFVALDVEELSLVDGVLIGARYQKSESTWWLCDDLEYVVLVRAHTEREALKKIAAIHKRNEERENAS